MDNQYISVGAREVNSDSSMKSVGAACYIDDIRLPRMLHCAILFSPHAHARIKHIDTSKAEALDGVRGVIHCFNTPRNLYNSAMRFYTDTSPSDMPKTEMIFDPVVKFVGDRVAAVAAESEDIARKALSYIEVAYEELDAVTTLEHAMQEHSPQANPAGIDGTNVCGAAVAYGSGSEQEVLLEVSQSPVRLTSKFRTSRVHHAYLEPVCHIASYTPDGHLAIWTSGQNVFCFRDVLSEALGIPQNRIRLIKTTCGGAFGGKLEVMHEPVAALLSKATGRPVKLRLNRREVFSSTRCRHEALITIQSGVHADGTLAAQHVHSALNTGAYATSGPNTAGAQSGKTFVMYRAKHMFYNGTPYYTNTPIAGAMRGYGCPQLMVSREAHLDRIARALSMDPVEFRLKNALEPYAENCMGKPMHNARLIQCIKEGAERFEWKRRREEARTGQGTKARGIGMGAAAHGAGWYPVYQDMTSVTMMMNNDGSLQLLTGIHDLGTGAKTVLAQIAKEVLTVPLDLIQVIEADTAVAPLDLGAQASRSTYIGGNCVKECAEELKRQLTKEAAGLLEQEESELSVKGMHVHCTKTGRSVSFADIVDSAQKGTLGPQRQIGAFRSFCSREAVYSYSAVFADVEVDTDSGEVEVKEMLSVHNSGTVINPALAEGQVHGGVHMGLGYALSEDMMIDEQTGKVENPTFKKYRLFRSHEMPRIHVHFLEEPEESGPYGAKSIGECATDGVAGAIVNAVSHALGGADIDRIPMTPEYLKSLIRR